MLFGTFFLAPFLIMTNIPWPHNPFLIVLCTAVNIHYVFLVRILLRPQIMTAFIVALVIFCFIMVMLSGYHEYNMRRCYQTLVDSQYKRVMFEHLLSDTTDICNTMVELLLMQSTKLTSRMRLLLVTKALRLHPSQVLLTSHRPKRTSMRTSIIILIP